MEEAILKELNSYLDSNAHEFIINVRDILRDRYDVIIIVTGKRGIGKSTLSLILAKLIDYSFNFKRLAFTPEEIIPVLQSMKWYQAMIMDEGGEIWAREEWASRVSRAITKQVIGDRYLYSARFILAPTIFMLNKRAIEMADYWIKIKERGLAEIRIMNEKDYYDLKLPYAPPEWEVEFDDLPDDIAEKYRDFKAKRGRERSEKYSQTIEDEIFGKKSKYVSLDDIAEKVSNNLDNYTVNGLIDWRLVYNDFQNQGLGQSRAKSIAFVLNRNLQLI